MSDNRVRGAWGEVQLRRALELAGLSRHVDFAEQSGITDGAASGRPDVVVHLPNGHDVVIDSKVPLDRYLQAVDATDPAAEHELQVEHAKAVARHAKDLAGRNYATLLESSIDLVLMFLPGESFLAAALDADPTLFESAAAKGVYLVTPSSLVPLLRGIALGWRERQAEQAAAEIHQLGIELHDRIGLFAEHYTKVGKQLDRTVAAYNTSMGSFETRLADGAQAVRARRSIVPGSGQPAEIETRPASCGRSRRCRPTATRPSLPPRATRPRPAVRPRAGGAGRAVGGGRRARHLIGPTARAQPGTESRCGCPAPPRLRRRARVWAAPGPEADRHQRTCATQAPRSGSGRRGLGGTRTHMHLGMPPGTATRRCDDRRQPTGAAGQLSCRSRSSATAPTAG